MDDTFLRLRKWGKRNLTWIYFVTAIVFILLPNTEFSPFSKDWNVLFEKIGLVALTSGVFAGVLKSIQFSGLFKEELSKVVSGTAFLNNRKDLPELWKKISKAIYAQKFPEISALLENRILETYFPTTTNHYNEDFVISIVIHELTDDMVITYTQTVEYFAILDSEKNESFIGYTQSISNSKNVEEKNQLLSFSVDGIEFANSDLKGITEANGKIKNTHTIPIRGKRKFKVFLKVKNTYSLKGENYKLMRFNTITKNVDVTISHGKDMDVSFFNVGLVNAFVPIHTDIENTVSRRHRDDLILPKQGFGLSFNKK